MAEWEGSPIQEEEFLENRPTKPTQRTGKIFTCRHEGCSSFFKKNAHLNRHELIHNDVRPFSCSFEGCDKAFRSQSHMKRHEISHTGKKDFRCEYEGCGVACFNAWSLKRHVKRTHEGTFKCFQCDKEFKKNKLLQDHISMEHKRSTITCTFPGCANVFKNAAKMRHHQKVHSGKGYACPVKDCSKKFSLWSECRLHSAECKTKEKNCGVCGKAFTTRSNLKTHKKVHDEEREVFACQYDGCGRFYTKQYNLKVHIQGFHQNIRPFDCPKQHCNRSFSFKHLLRNHLEWHCKKDHTPQKPSKRKRPKRMVTSDISAITGYIPEMWTKITPEEMNAYVNENEHVVFDSACMDDTDIIPRDYETTQAEMTSETEGEKPSTSGTCCEEEIEEEEPEDGIEIYLSDNSEETLTPKSDLEVDFDDDELIILEPSTLEEASYFLDRLNKLKKHSSSPSSNSSRSSSACGGGGGYEMKLLNERLQQLVSHQKKENCIGAIEQTCRMQTTSKTDSDSSDNERNLLCAS